MKSLKNISLMMLLITSSGSLMTMGMRTRVAKPTPTKGTGSGGVKGAGRATRVAKAQKKIAVAEAQAKVAQSLQAISRGNKGRNTAAVASRISNANKVLTSPLKSQLVSQGIQLKSASIPRTQTYQQKNAVAASAKNYNTINAPRLNSVARSHALSTIAPRAQATFNSLTSQAYNAPRNIANSFANRNAPAIGPKRSVWNEGSLKSAVKATPSALYNAPRNIANSFANRNAPAIGPKRSVWNEGSLKSAVKATPSALYNAPRNIANSAARAMGRTQPVWNQSSAYNATAGKVYNFAKQKYTQNPKLTKLEAQNFVTRQGDKAMSPLRTTQQNRVAAKQSANRLKEIGKLERSIKEPQVRSEAQSKTMIELQPTNTMTAPTGRMPNLSSRSRFARNSAVPSLAAPTNKIVAQKGIATKTVNRELVQQNKSAQTLQALTRGVQARTAQRAPSMKKMQSKASEKGIEMVEMPSLSRGSSTSSMNSMSSGYMVPRFVPNAGIGAVPASGIYGANVV